MTHPGSRNGSALTVVHATALWLGQTEAWLHTQLAHMPPSVENVVVCFRRRNVDQFPMPATFALEDRSRLRYYAEEGLRTLGYKRRRPFLEAVSRQVGAELVHSHFGTRGWENAQAVRRLRVKHLVSFYGYDATYLPREDPKWQGRFAELFALADGILCEAPCMRETLLGIGAPPERVFVSHIGVALDRLPFSPRVPVDGEPIRVLVAGAFQEKKGIPYAVEAVARASSDVPLDLTIVGDAHARQERSRAEKERILAALEAPALRGRVRLLGFQPHASLLDEAYRHHLTLAPSVTASDGDTEGGLPYVLTELVATGMPAIATRHCDIPELIEDGVSGFLVPERDSDAIADRIVWLASHPDAWRGLAERGRDRVEREFSGDVQGRRLASLYESLISGRASSPGP